MTLPIFVITWVILTLNYRMAEAEAESRNTYTLDSVREALIRQEDTIVFNVIERAKYPINSHTYRENYTSNIPGFCGSLVEFIVKDTEAIQAKVNIIQFLQYNIYCRLWDSLFSHCQMMWPFLSSP